MRSAGGSTATRCRSSALAASTCARRSSAAAGRQPLVRDVVRQHREQRLGRRDPGRGPVRPRTGAPPRRARAPRRQHRIRHRLDAVPQQLLGPIDGGEPPAGAAAPAGGEEGGEGAVHVVPEPLHARMVDRATDSGRTGTAGGDTAVPAALSGAARCRGCCPRCRGTRRCACRRLDDAVVGPMPGISNSSKTTPPRAAAPSRRRGRRSSRPSGCSWRTRRSRSRRPRTRSGRSCRRAAVVLLARVHAERVVVVAAGPGEVGGGEDGVCFGEHGSVPFEGSGGARLRVGGAVEALEAASPVRAGVALDERRGKADPRADGTPSRPSGGGSE